MPILVFKTEWPCRIWLSGSDELDLAKKLIRIPFYTNTLIPLNFACVNFLLAMKRAFTSLLLTVIRGGLYVGYTFILYYTRHDNPERMMYAYNMDDCTLFLMSWICVLPQLIKVYKEAKATQSYQYESLGTI